MLKSLSQKLLYSFGKNYALDKTIPESLVLRFLLKKGIMMLRGILKTRRKLFLGKKVKIYNKSNFEFGKGCTLDDYVILDCYGKNRIKFGNTVKIGAYSRISVTSHLSKLGEGLSIGSNSAIGEYSYFGCAGGLEIGDNVIMGQYISFHTENHNFSNRDKLIREQGVTSKGIIIGNNIWVGAKVTFLDGSQVGDNSVVAAGAVVKDEFPPNVVIGGVPAKIIKEL
ncbi:acyltransferase [[Muricauda] lutisoli]|uniref:Acyltransferase n=1 Tax=[Muricauda] lutisoli TaxID=2816035 RepID=A0ABS3EXF8_9FLAO|nr:acyltransferase [[Muricauda] lutisoli]MBO0330933.1 acyltransferase [[Muricauda] lutisoli]